MARTDCFLWHRDFVTAWQQSSDLPELCSRLGMQPRQASNVAAKLRRRGVSLKNMPVGGGLHDRMEFLSEGDISELNCIVSEIEERKQRKISIKQAAELADKARKKASRVG